MRCAQTIFRVRLSTPRCFAYTPNLLHHRRPGVPAGIETQLTVAVVMVLSGSPEDFPIEKQDAMREVMATEAGVPVDDVIIIITSASVNVEFQIKVTDGSDAATIKDKIADDMSTVDGAQAFLSSVPGVTVLSTPVVEEKVVAAITPPGPPPASAVGAIVGGVIGGICSLFLLGGIFYMVKKRKQGGTTYPA